MQKNILSNIQLNREKKWRILVLILLLPLLLSVYFILKESDYKGSAEFHSTTEMISSLISIIAGLIIVVRYYLLGNRMLLFIGLAYCINGAEDFVHGILSFPLTEIYTGLPASSLKQYIPGTYVTGRFIFALLLLIAPYTNTWNQKMNRKKGT